VDDGSIPTPKLEGELVWTRFCASPVIEGKKYNMSVQINAILALRRAVNHPSVFIKPRERGCFADFYCKKSAYCRGIDQFLWLVTAGAIMQVSFLIRSKTSPLNPLSSLARGLKPTHKMVFSPFSSLEKGVGEMRLKKLYTPSLFTNNHYGVSVAQAGDSPPAVSYHAPTGQGGEGFQS
jgi:hypothetical protein